MIKRAVNDSVKLYQSISQIVLSKHITHNSLSKKPNIYIKSTTSSDSSSSSLSSSSSSSSLSSSSESSFSSGFGLSSFAGFATAFFLEASAGLPNRTVSAHIYWMKTKKSIYLRHYIPFSFCKTGTSSSSDESGNISAVAPNKNHTVKKTKLLKFNSIKPKIVKYN